MPAGEAPALGAVRLPSRPHAEGSYGPEPEPGQLTPRLGGEGGRLVSPARVVWLATTNAAKADQLARLLEGLPLQVRRLSEAPPIDPPLETGQSYAENARLKAEHYSRHLDGLVLASDGGVEIPSLGERWQGLYTGRAAGAVDDEAKLAHLLRLLAPYSGEDRRAFFHESLALAEAGVVRATWSATSRPGYLAASYDPAKLRRGFWVATVWIYPELGKTHAELSPGEEAQVATHWTRLREAVHAYFQC